MEYFNEKEDDQIWTEKIKPFLNKRVAVLNEMSELWTYLKKYYNEDGNGYTLKPEVEVKPEKPEYIIGTVAPLSFMVAGGASALMFLFHGIVWILRHFTAIGWNTLNWALTVLLWSMAIAAALSLIAAIIDLFRWRRHASKQSLYEEYWSHGVNLDEKYESYKAQLDSIDKQLDGILNEQFENLSDAIGKSLGLPMPVEGLDAENYFDIRTEYLNLEDLQQKATNYKQQEKRKDAFRRLMDAKLKFFYHHTLPVGTSPKVYGMFAKQLEKSDDGLMSLRREVPHSRAMRKLKSTVLGFKQELNPKGFDFILDEFNGIYHRSTRQDLLFFLTDTQKKARQTKDMYKVAKRAGKVYDLLADKIRKTAIVLDYARACAYHNVYLGVELMNYIRESSGGGSMKKATDKAVVASTDTNALSVRTADMMMDVSDKDVRSGLAKVDKDIQSTARFLFSSNEMRQWSSDNLNASLAVVGIGATISFAWHFGGMIIDYFKKINANTEAQYKMVEYMNQLSTAYQKSVGEIMRSIEIIESLSNCNRGFATIYVPLRERVLIEGDMNLTRVELAPLALATNKYKKITESRLKNNDDRKEQQ